MCFRQCTQRQRLNLITRRALLNRQLIFNGKLEKLIKVEKDHKLRSVNSFVLFNPIQTALGGGGGGFEAKHLQTEKHCMHCRGDRNIKDTAARLTFKTTVDWQIGTFPLANQHF